MAKTRKVDFLFLLCILSSFAPVQLFQTGPVLKRVTRSQSDEFESSEEFDSLGFDSNEDYNFDDSFETLRRRRSFDPVRVLGKRLKKQKAQRRTNDDEESSTPWSLDTGIVPESLQGDTGPNDGLDGIAAANDVPLNDLFNPNRFDNNEENNDILPVSESNDFGNNADDETWPEAASTDQPFGFDDETQPVNNWDTTVKNINEDDVPQDCTCMSIIECGGTFRSADLSPDICEDGDVCCPIPNTEPTVPNTPACGVGRPNETVKARVQESTAKYGELPWTVMLLKTPEDDDSMFCAGTIIHLQIVLTAAHCVDKFKNNMDSLIVRGGKWDMAPWRLNQPVQDRTILSITFHPSFRSGKPAFDLALLFLNEPFTYAENINTVCLPSNLAKIDETRCVASGWGEGPKAPSREVMKKVPLPIVSDAECQASLRTTRLGRYFRLHKSFVCAGGVGGHDVCLGNGGGPLTCPIEGTDTMVVMGITSWGVDCGLPGIPGVFSNVVAELQWIEETVQHLLTNE